jgi:hypothetical protein
MRRVMRLAPALIAAILVFGLVFGVGQAAAASLPGEPLYELKLASEEVRLGLTQDPESRAKFRVILAEERLEEISALVEQGRAVDDSAVARAQQQLTQAFEAAAQGEKGAAPWAFQRLMAAIQKHRRTMLSAASALPEGDQEPLRQLLREMDRVRQELHVGQGVPAEEPERMRYGTPPESEDLPDPSEQPGPGPGPQATHGPFGPQPVNPSGPGPQPTAAIVEPDPTARPSGPSPVAQPGAGESQPTPVPTGTGPAGVPNPGDSDPSQGQSPNPGHGAGGGNGRP